MVRAQERGRLAPGGNATLEGREGSRALGSYLIGPMLFHLRPELPPPEPSPHTVLVVQLD